MKQKLLTLAVLLLVGFLTCTAKAAEDVQNGTVVEDGYLKYTVLSTIDHTVKAEIRKELPSSEIPVDISIPDYFTIDGQDFTVVEVGKVGHSTCQSIKLPRKLKVLRDYALSGCKNLKSIVLPESLDSIGNYAFQNCALRSIEIPDSVTWIGEFAFQYCSQLTKASLGKNARASNSAFSACPKLYSFTIKNPIPPEQLCVTIYSEMSIYVPDESLDLYRKAKWWKYQKYIYAISDPHEFCVAGIWYTKHGDEIGVISSLSDDYSGNIIIPETMVFNGEELQCNAIKTYAFQGYEQLTGIQMPVSVKKIEASAFKDCLALSEVSLPDSLTEIPKYAFSNCQALKSINLPSTVVKVGEQAFSYAQSLEDINISGLNEIGPQAFFETKLKEVRLHCPIIYGSTFYDCRYLKTVILEEGVQDIWYGAFGGYTKLETLQLPKSLKQIGANAFNSIETIILKNETPPTEWGTPFTITSTSTLYVPKGTRDLYAAADYWKDFPYILEGEYDANNSVIIDGVEYRFVGEGEAIAVASSPEISGNIKILSEIEINGNKCTVVSIPDNAFNDCRMLTSVSIPSTIKHIGEKAFNYCLELSTVEFSEGLTSIGNSAFRETALTSLEIPSSVKEIGQWAFQKCTNLTSINFGTGIEVIGNEAFIGAIRVQKLELPASLKTVGKDAFNWNRLAVVILKSNEPLFLEESPFLELNEDSFLTLFVPKGTKSKYSVANIWKDFKHIMEYQGQDFEFSVDVNGMTYWPINDYEACGILKDKTRNIEVESSVTINGRNYRVTLLPESAFSTHQGIKSLNIPYGITTIGPAAMMMQVCLPSIDIPNSVKTIGRAAFYMCELFTSVTLGNSVEYIGGGAFDMCTNLRTLTSLNPEPPILGEDVFNGVNKSYCTLRVPVGSKAKYANAPQWKDFANIEEFGVSSVFIIDDNTFTISTDGQVAFALANPGSDELIIPSSITVYQNDSPLFRQGASRANEFKTVYNVTSIAKDAFLNCDNLKKLTLECELPPFVLNDCFVKGIRDNCELVYSINDIKY